MEKPIWKDTYYMIFSKQSCWIKEAGGGEEEYTLHNSIWIRL